MSYKHPMENEPVVAAPKPKTPNRFWLKVGCSGCLIVFLALSGVAGYLYYLEEGRSLSDPQEEVASMTITSDTTFELKYQLEGTGYSHLSLWLVADGSDDRGAFVVRGDVTCDGTKKSVEEHFAWAKRSAQDEGEVSGWFHVSDSYVHSGTELVCTGKLKAAPGKLRTGRLVLTRMQRPSDWL